MSNIENARIRINEIDREMARLFCERMDAAAEVAEYKRDHGMPILDREREEKLIQKNMSYITDDSLTDFYTNFIRSTIDISKNYQRRILEGMKVAYCGTEGAFAYLVAEKIFESAEKMPFESFSKAYESVVEGVCDVAVLPVENSYAGDVGQVSDLLFSGSLYVTGMYDFPVSHNLLAVEGAKKSDIKTVVSHPQALSQCSEYITRNGFSRMQYENTAFAARFVAENKDPSIAAIASEDSAKRYGLSVIDRQINESRNNTTKFAVVSRSENMNVGYSPSDRFLLLFTVSNEVGSLAKVMNEITRHGFNMSAIHSRPMKDLLWKYYFLVEAEGAIRTENGKQFLATISQSCDKLRLAGVYA
ncbi:MAG: chorismate mutase [Clostridia bacterium]|nr:chorismate mutase [Clostridia bacterium]